MARIIILSIDVILAVIVTMPLFQESSDSNTRIGAFTLMAVFVANIVQIW